MIVGNAEQMVHDKLTRSSCATVLRQISRHLSPTLLLYTVSKNDIVSSCKDQIMRYEGIETVKKLHVEAEAGHEELLTGAHLARVIEIQVEFIKVISLDQV